MPAIKGCDDNREATKRLQDCIFAALLQYKLTSTRRTIAIHEAGHAVIATAEGRKVTRVWFDRGGGGVTRYDRKTRGRAEVRIAIAGLAAELLFDRDADPGIALMRSIDEVGEFSLLVGKANAKVFAQVIDVLEARRDQVNEIVKALERRGSLSSSWWEAWRRKAVRP